MLRIIAAVVIAMGLAAPAWAGLDQARAAYESGDYATALRLYLPLAEDGDADAQVRLGTIYFLGLGVPQNDAEAVKWYRLAADQGNAQTQFTLATLYLYRQSVQDYSKAADWLHRAAEQGHSVAQVLLGNAYANGQGVPQDYAEGVRWYRLAAEQGEPDAQFNLGVMYDEGRGVPQDYAEAVKWYQKAAEQGRAEAQYRLGVAYNRGEGVPQDYSEAVKWFRKAAEQRHAGAQDSLGEAYGHGKGVPQDFAEAAKWYQEAAEQGYVFAQSDLGVMYLHGQGVPQNYVLAHMWLNLAASGLPPSKNLDDAVRNREIAESRMTPAEIAEAKRLARDWRKTAAPAWAEFDEGRGAGPAYGDVDVVEELLRGETFLHGETKTGDVLYCTDEAATGFQWSDGNARSTRFLEKRYLIKIVSDSERIITPQTGDSAGQSDRFTCKRPWLHTAPNMVSCTDDSGVTPWIFDQNRYTRAYLNGEPLGHDFADPNIIVAFGTCTKF